MKAQENIYAIVFRHKDIILVVGKTEILKFSTRKNTYPMFKIFLKNFEGIAQIPYQSFLILLSTAVSYL